MFEGREVVEAQIQALLDSVADLRGRANVNACFGEPVTAAGHTVIPVAKVSYAFALGAGYGPGAVGEDEGEAAEQTGGGGGVRAHPLAIVEVTPQGTRVEPVIDRQKVALAGALLAGWVVLWLAVALVGIFGQHE